MTPLRLCFVGDSMVNGTGDPECLGWAGRICTAAIRQGHDITYYNLGIRRETSADIAKRWEAEVSCRLPQDNRAGIIFSFGVNDMTVEADNVRVPLTDSVDYARQILIAARQRCPVLMVSPPPIADLGQNLRISKLSQYYNRVCQELNIPYLDAFAPLQSSQIWMQEVATYDGAHPGSAGYQVFADLVQYWQAWLELLNQE